MTVYHFQAYKGRAEHRFTCPSCGKPNRVRSFTVEHTVNPFNKNDDGTIRTPSEVSRRAQQAAKQERDEFAHKPLCASCENTLPYAEARALREERQSLAALSNSERTDG